jgi:hypothetical protein
MATPPLRLTLVHLVKLIVEDLVLPMATEPRYVGERGWLQPG